MAFLREYNKVACFTAPLLKPDGTFAGAGDWSPAVGDVKISKNSEASTNIANLPQAISGMNAWKFWLTADEASAKEIVITISDQDGNAVQEDSFVVNTFGPQNALLELLDETDVNDAGGLLLETTISNVSTQTSFDLTDGASFNGAYDKALIVVRSAGSVEDVAFGQVESYSSTGKTITLGTPLSLTVSTGQQVKIYASLASPAANDTEADFVNLLDQVSDTRSGPAWYFDATGDLQQTADLGGGSYALRADAYGWNGLPLGLLLEPERTNSIPNNQMTGAVVGTIGSGGVMPNEWYISAAGVMTTTINSFGTHFGMPYIELALTINNNSGNTKYPGIGFIDNSGPNASSTTIGETWALSAITEVKSGSIPANTIFLQLAEADSTDDYIDSSRTYLTDLTQNQLAYTSHVRTMADSTVAIVKSKLSFEVANNVSFSTTIRVYVPQLEKGGFATSPILTSSGPVTRTGDPQPIISDTSAGQTAGTFLVDFRMLSDSNNGSTGRLLETHSADGNDVALQLTRNDASNVPAILSGASSFTEAFSPSATVSGDDAKVAASWDNTQVQCVKDGSAGTAVGIGSGGSYSGGKGQWRIRSNANDAVAIRDLKVFDHAKSEAEMITLTS